MILLEKDHAEAVLMVSTGHCGRRSPIEVDTSRYHDVVEHEGLEPEQSVQFLTALWSVVVAFIDLGFSVHPVQAAVANSTVGESSGDEILRTIQEFVREAA